MQEQQQQIIAELLDKTIIVMEILMTAIYTMIIFMRQQLLQRVILFVERLLDIKILEQVLLLI